jgi:hypothetical protein
MVRQRGQCIESGHRDYPVRSKSINKRFHKVPPVLDCFKRQLKNFPRMSNMVNMGKNYI